MSRGNTVTPSWTIFTNHARVLMCLATNPSNGYGALRREFVGSTAAQANPVTDHFIGDVAKRLAFFVPDTGMNRSL